MLRYFNTVSGDAGNEQVQEAVQQIQQGAIQYQPQYVDQGSSSDSSLYAANNGPMYGYISRPVVSNRCVVC